MVMARRLPLFLLLLLYFSLSNALKNLDPRVIDDAIKDSVLQSFGDHRKTAVLYNMSAPANFSSVTVFAVRYRASGIWRLGADVKEFHVQPLAAAALPGTKRLLVVRQNLGRNLSSAYSTYGNISGLRLASPVLGLLIYRLPPIIAAGNKSSRSHLNHEQEVVVMRKPITVNFSGIVENRSAISPAPLCALFELDGTVSLSNQSYQGICLVWRIGHYALVMEGSKVDASSGCGGRDWKVILATAMAGVFGALLLVLLVTAVINVRRRRAEVAEMERRAYENEALRMSMVGHVRAPVAAETRTAPALEDDYDPSTMI